MNNLIKNELIKIFHKKAIYVISIITTLLVILTLTLIVVDRKNEDNTKYYSYLESNLKSYDINNKDEVGWYISDLTEVETYKYVKEYKQESWQYYYIKNNLRELIYSRNEAKYLNKDENEIKEKETKINNVLEEIKNNEWTYFVKKEKQNILEEKKSYEELQKNKELSDSEKTYLGDQIKICNIKLEGIEYRLTNNIAPDNSDMSFEVDQYVTSAIEYQNDLARNKKNQTYEEEYNSKEIEANYKISKYKVDNKIISPDGYSINKTLSEDFLSPIIFVVVVIIMVSSSILAEEFSKGTIKQLLLRPHTRTKILLSKYITCLIVFILFVLFYSTLEVIGYGIISGFSSLKDPIVIYNFTTGTAESMSLIKYCFINFLGVLPEYLILMTLAFFIGVVSSSTSIAVTITFLTYFFSAIINALAQSFDLKMLRYLPTMCWQLNEYLFGGMSYYKYGSMTNSIIVSTITLLLLITSSFVIFNKKNIKNQ